jgi:YfiH family protein
VSCARNATRHAATAASPSLARRIADAGFDWIVPRWPAPESVRAFATTRNGGVSTGDCASLDLGGASMTSVESDRAAAIAENRRRVQAFLPAPPVWLAQVHGATVANIEAAPAPQPPRADAAVTRCTGVVLAVRIADCMPVLFADRDACVIGAAHAGWRGLAAGVLESTVDAMQIPPARIVAWLGPAIGRAAFEVGADVHEAFTRSDTCARRAFVAAAPGKWRADLEALARLRLERAGVRAIHGGGMCTLSDPGRFFSFRRDGTSGRMAAFVWREVRTTEPKLDEERP